MSFSHPRRTTKSSATALTPESSHSVNTTMSLQKGATFHAQLPHHFKVPALPRRSETTLEDVVDAHKRRVALTLGDIDRSLASIEEDTPNNKQTFRDESDPVSQSFLDHTVGLPSLKSYGSIMDSATTQGSAIGRHSLRPRQNRRPSRYSDSALGSSIGSSTGKKVAETQATSVTDERSNKSIVQASAITRSAAHTSTIENLHTLSSRANNRIHEYVLKPLLAKPSLKEFQLIVKDCPRRIHTKEIVCLRDLEKTLIFMAPEKTKSAALYLDFCLTSIRCIQATVEFLNEREQTRPHDRPYTNGYFVDLVDQIQQYAQQVQAAKERESNGEKLGDMDPESTDEVKLYGGLTKNGRPAELVRVKKNGKAISIATGEPVDLEEDSKDSMRFKRSLSQEAEDDEAIMRSMARRKRSASAAELAPKRCREPGCDKEFKRPCDLTKHEKTHSRPWKCPVDTCKYHEYGWPTEKEMDRHHNDKHSSAPPLYECHFKPCPYRSKRESNCKQHMEKAHGWQYVRSKNNGKIRPDNRSTGAQSIVNGGLPTPQSTNFRTPSTDGMGVATPPEDNEFDFNHFDNSMLYDNQNQRNYPSYPTDIDLFGTSTNLQLDYSPISENRQSESPAGHSPFVVNSELGQNHFQDNFSTMNNNVDFSLFEQEDLYSANVQLPTPTHDVFNRALATFETSGVLFNPDPIPHISPVGHGNAMLYTPTSLREDDEAFEDFIPLNHQQDIAADFQLFPTSTGGSGTISSSAPSALFGEMPRGFPGVSAQELLDFYAASTAAAAAGHPQHYQQRYQPQYQHNQQQIAANIANMNLDWSSDDNLSAGYRSQ